MAVAEIQNVKDHRIHQQHDGDENTNCSIRNKIWMAPMVRGSDLAFRNLVRQQGHIATPCFSPMIRADQVLEASHYLATLKNPNDISPDDLQHLHEDVVLVLTDIFADQEPLIVQLCGCHPDVLYRACRFLLQLKNQQSQSCKIVGLDLNLGCPQDCANVCNFGAFLAEEHPDLALQCVAAMKRAIYEDQRDGCTNPPRLSCKIRLRETTQETIDFARQLQNHGCELLTLHCRRRQDKHDGAPDYKAGKQLVQALQDSKFRILINGDVVCLQDAERVLTQTQAHGIMIARGFLKNPLLLLNTTTTMISSSELFSPSFTLSMAALYLEHVEQHSPPSSLYVRKHLQWLFRAHLRPSNGKRFENFSDDDWKSKLWTFLQRPYLETVYQFRCLLGLYSRNWMEEGVEMHVPASLVEHCHATFREIRHGRVPSKNEDGKVEEEGLGAGLFDC